MTFNLFHASTPTVLWLALLLISLILPWVIFNRVGWVICLLDLITHPPPLVIKNVQRISVSGQVWCKQLLICQLGERILEMKAIKRKPARKWLSAQKKWLKDDLSCPAYSVLWLPLVAEFGTFFSILPSLKLLLDTFNMPAYILHQRLKKQKQKQKTNGKKCSGCFADLFIKKWQYIYPCTLYPGALGIVKQPARSTLH